MYYRFHLSCTIQYNKVRALEFKQRRASFFRGPPQIRIYTFNINSYKEAQRPTKRYKRYDLKSYELHFCSRSGVPIIVPESNIGYEFLRFLTILYKRYTRLNRKSHELLFITPAQLYLILSEFTIEYQFLRCWTISYKMVHALQYQKRRASFLEPAKLYVILYWSLLRNSSKRKNIIITQNTAQSSNYVNVSFVSS